MLSDLWYDLWYNPWSDLWSGLQSNPGYVNAIEFADSAPNPLSYSFTKQIINWALQQCHVALISILNYSFLVI